MFQEIEWIHKNLLHKLKKIKIIKISSHFPAKYCHLSYMINYTDDNYPRMLYEFHLLEICSMQEKSIKGGEGENGKKNCWLNHAHSNNDKKNIYKCYIRSLKMFLRPDYSTLLITCCLQKRKQIFDIF